MKVEKIRIGNKEVMPFTIPSGIVMTEVSCLEKIARNIPEIGILTTKSIGPQPRTGNREPILALYYPGCFVNAVGLTNPGAEEFAKKLVSADIPSDKFLLASIFGKDADEFVYVVNTLERLVDGFELNLSCPHTIGYGMQLGQDPQIVAEITKAVTRVTRKPVFAKLTPNASNIGLIAKSAMNAGVYGLIAINTVGPGFHSVDGFPVLTNKIGGLSGRGILPVGLKCVREISDAVGDVPIGAMGGIATARDVEAYAAERARFFGIGSALAGMNDEEVKKYFSVVVYDLSEGTNNAEELLKEVAMKYKRVEVTKKIDVACDLKIISTNYSIDAEPGQFVFAWIPGEGEKPFSVMDDEPLTFGVLSRGNFTTKLNSLKEGDSFYVRGPYGKAINIPAGSQVVLVGGGCGIAGLYLLAKKASEKIRLKTFLGAKDREHLLYVHRFNRYGEVRVATEDGSLGIKGLVSDLIRENNFSNNTCFFNCGPKTMIDAVLPLELKVTSPDRVYSSLDYMTRCGVGLCGSCADEKGRRSCVEGPFLNP